MKLLVKRGPVTEKGQAKILCFCELCSLGQLQFFVHGSSVPSFRQWVLFGYEVALHAA
jgi:hypothetical protein